MLLIKLSTSDGAAVSAAAKTLGEQSTIKNAAEKAVTAAKQIIDRELLRLRDTDPSQLPEKEIVMVQVGGQDVLKIERKGASRLDGAGLASAHPEVAAEFTKRGVASYYSALI